MRRCNTSCKSRGRDQRGYVMVVVLLLLAVLLSAGLFGIQSMESDLRASQYLRKSEVLARAAEAGAAHRISEISLSKDDAASAIKSAIGCSGGFACSNPSWQSWPATNSGFSASYDVFGLAQYQVQSAPIATIDSKPPAGVQIASGGQTTLWEITSYAVPGANLQAGEHAVSVGVKLWSKGGPSYND
jgi:hypothetical protein